MKCFKYKIFKDSELILTNWINAESKEKAIAELQPLKDEYKATDLTIIEVHGAL